MGLKVLSRVAVPDTYPHAVDIRWAGEDAVWLAAARQGVIRLSLAGPEKGSAVPEMGFWLSLSVASSDAYLATAASFRELAWRDQEAAGRTGSAVFDTIWDIDLDNDRLLVMGSQRGENGQWSPDGAMAWLGSLETGLKDLRPVYFALQGPQPTNFNRCGIMRLSAVRFLDDGRFVIVPGVEPGVYLFDAEGSLERTWETEPLQVDTLCDISEEAESIYHLQVPPRFRWLDQRRIVEEVLPLSQGLALLLRHNDGDGPRWQLAVLNEAGTTRHDVPIEPPPGRYRLRADVRGGRIAFLLLEVPQGPDAAVETPLVYVTGLPE